VWDCPLTVKVIFVSIRALEAPMARIAESLYNGLAGIENGKCGGREMANGGGRSDREV
jgi:hypothetical protein